MRVEAGIGSVVTTVNCMDSVRRVIDGLSAIERPAVALVALARFAARFRIDHAELMKFISHLWGVVDVTPETWVSWADAFDHMEILKPPHDYSVDLARAIPAAVISDFSALARAVFETSEATWYCSNTDGTRDALLMVLELLGKHGVSAPDLAAFRLSPDNCGDSWGPKPSEGILVSWKAMALPNKTMEPTR
jgi:hypothetical protein